MKRLPVVKKVAKGVVFYAFIVTCVATITFAYNSAWIPMGQHVLVEKQPISHQHGWDVFEKDGEQRKVLTWDLNAVPLGTQKDIKTSWINRGVNRMM